MNRRQFLTKASAALAVRVNEVLPLGVQSSAINAQFRPIRRSVGVFTGRGGTMGWLVNPEAVVVIDSQFADSAHVFLDALRFRTGRHIDLLLNTHHHPDHTGGNGVLRSAVTSIVAHKNAPALQRAQALVTGTAEGQTYADTTFTTTWKAHIGDEVVEATHYGPGHTGGDAVYRFERANVVHMGDLVYHQRHPSADRAAGGSLRHWIACLERVVKDHAPDTLYIFGHATTGAPVRGDRRDLLVVRDCLSSLLDIVQKGIQSGKSVEEITSDWNVPGFNHLSGEPDFQTAYDELTGHG
jgi:cyclase